MQEKLRIGICDDEKVIHGIMETIIASYGEEKNIVTDITYYESGIALLNSHDVPNLDILFLDIDMPELDGVETAYKLNECKHHCKIVMLTSKVERFKEAFKIGAFRFVTKPIEEQEVFDAMDDVRARMIGNKPYCLLREGKRYTVMQKEVMYVMIDKFSTYLYTQKNDFRSEETLDWWEKELDSRLFFRCHRSYIVNLSEIKEIHKKQIELFTGEHIPVAKRRIKELERCYMKYDTKYR